MAIPERLEGHLRQPIERQEKLLPVAQAKRPRNRRWEIRAR